MEVAKKEAEKNISCHYFERWCLLCIHPRFWTLLVSVFHSNVNTGSIREPSVDFWPSVTVGLQIYVNFFWLATRGEREKMLFKWFLSDISQILIRHCPKIIWTLLEKLSLPSLSYVISWQRGIQLQSWSSSFVNPCCFEKVFP